MMRSARPPPETTAGTHEQATCHGRAWRWRGATGGRRRAMRYTFGDYVLDTQRQELHQAGAPIPLRRKVLQVLAYLLAHRNRVVPKQELLEQLWPDQFVGDEALTSCVRTLRHVLGERGRTPRCLRTVHGQGYRFVAAVAVQESRLVDDAPPARPLHGGEGATCPAAVPSP